MGVGVRSGGHVTFDTLTIMVKIALENDDDTRWIGVMLGAGDHHMGKADRGKADRGTADRGKEEKLTSELPEQGNKE